MQLTKLHKCFMQVKNIMRNSKTLKTNSRVWLIQLWPNLTMIKMC
ncbi:unnamed protein product [Rhodiola kirilowii]